MSIASEIQDLTTNLTAAKNAVTAKGGTVGDTGLAGLATEIASIPSGGGSEDWGTVTYLDSNNQLVTATIQNQYEYSTLGNSNSSGTWSLVVDNQTVPITQVTGVALGTSAKALPDYFLYKCPNNFTFSATSLISIGRNALSGCTAFNNAFTLPNTLTKIGDYFMSACTSFNQDLTIPEGLVEIGISFFQGCTAFNSSLSLPTTLSIIGNNFMKGCTAFNQPIDVSHATSIGGYFMQGCTAFDQEIDISGLTTINSYFLTGCTSFNSPITMPNVTSIVGGYFLNGCTAYNQILELNNVTALGSYFMNNCTSFVQRGFYIYGTTGTYFMYNCKKFTGTLFAECATPPSGNYSLATNDSSASIYASGVIVKGTYASAWGTALPNRPSSGSSPYRKLTIMS